VFGTLGRKIQRGHDASVGNPKNSRPEAGGRQGRKQGGACAFVGKWHKTKIDVVERG
jgi:hypothetical protein